MVLLGEVDGKMTGGDEGDRELRRDVLRLLLLLDILGVFWDADGAKPE